MTNDIIIPSVPKSIGNITVTRCLPNAKKRQLGPFVFIDHMGPIEYKLENEINVLPHPHIGLMTVTYFLSGEGFHTDSLGSKQQINIGDINLMIAGKGIVHAEKSRHKQSDSTKKIHMLQIWIALPKEQEECEPEFINYTKDKLPKFLLNQSLEMNLLIGKYNQYQSPVKTFTDTLYCIIESKNDSTEKLSFQYKELGILVTNGQAKINMQNLQANDLIILNDPHDIQIEVNKGTILACFGGTPYPEKRHIWWNFVATRKELIYQAAEKWKVQQMGTVPGETEYVPLPGEYKI
ncbi:pirin family protein [Pigmentibacter sp. JX0631]|uniref:pirin family protein n=1 Tax=Pigmentibacter sp. JX0631 TaxID=2976982 RepID=UPI0024683703|nr:pirin family protein [Pigmentibacter sp. JX0631]WGL59734.1 pirin family protein [Pigmentibacter sp. JX0631]